MPLGIGWGVGRGGRRGPTPAAASGLLWWARTDRNLFTTTAGGTPVTAEQANVASVAPAAGTVTGRLTQATGANCLVYDATKNCVVGFPNSTGWYDCPAGLDIDKRNFSIFLVVECHSSWAGGPGGVAADLYWGQTTAGANPLLIQQDTGGLAAYDAGYHNPPASAGSVPTLNRCLVGLVGRAGSLDTWVNGVKASTTPLSAGVTTLTNLLGANGGSAAQWRTFDLWLHNRAVADSEVTGKFVSYARSRGVGTAFTRNVLILSDSIGQGFGTTNARGWPSRLTLGPGVRIYTRAYAGNTAAIANTYRAGVCDPLLASGDLVVLHLGTNDIAIAAKTGAQAYASLTSIVSGLKAAVPGVKVMMLTCLPRTAGVIAGEYANLRNLELANTANADVVYDLISDTVLYAGWQNSTYTGDGTHPNDVGAQRIVDGGGGAVGLNAAILAA
jgi:lysophospholipase L1-like esterase